MKFLQKSDQRKGGKKPNVIWITEVEPSFMLPSDLQENNISKSDANYHNCSLCQNKTECKTSFHRKVCWLLFGLLVHLSFENYSWSDIFRIWLHFTMLLKQNIVQLGMRYSYNSFEHSLWNNNIQSDRQTCL